MSSNDTQSDPEQSTMEMFLKRALQNIWKDCNSKRLARLRESCSTTLGNYSYSLLSCELIYLSIFL